MTTCINLLETTEFSLNYCHLESPNYTYTEISQLLEVKKKLSQLESQFWPQKQYQQQLFFLCEYANQQALKARHQGQDEIWQNWQQITQLIDLVCESLEPELEDDDYLVY
jgi:hypothetical protein